MRNIAQSPYERIAGAIILQAVQDYRRAIKALAKGRKNHEAERTKTECLCFFRSQWFEALTDVDGEYLIQRLDAEVMA